MSRTILTARAGVAGRISGRLIAGYAIAAGAGVLAATGFVVNFVALRWVFLTGGTPASLAPAGPVCVDLFLILAAVALPVLGDREPRVRRYVVGLIVGTFTASAAGTAWHAWHVAGWLGVTVSLIFPSVTLAATHLAVLVIETTPSAAPVLVEAPAFAEEEEQPAEGKVMPSSSARIDPAIAAHVFEAITAMAEERSELTGKTVGARFGVSDRTGRRYIKLWQASLRAADIVGTSSDIGLT
jgi:hypothetical protein